MSDEANCRSCGELIVWITLEPTRKPHPVNAVPSTSGTIRVRLEGGRRVGKVLPRDERDGRLYVSHFATCPQAAGWRGARR